MTRPFVTRAGVVGPLVVALVVLVGCTGLFNPYPDAKYDCEESDCTRCVPIEGTPHPKGHLCSVTRDESSPPPEASAP